MAGSRLSLPRVLRLSGSAPAVAAPLAGEAIGRGAADRLTRLRAWVTRRVRPELAALMVVAGFLNLWNLSINGWANDYYAAAVRSMTLSWHNFLFASFDPSGVMTVDKPPLALWIQALSARIFGFNSLSILVPQALMGMATVALIYDLVRRRFGRVAGFVAGLTLAITPITVAMSRHNNPDNTVILCCVAALWLAVRGIEDGRARWIVWSGVAVGLGFEAKMGTALLVVPGIVLAWLWVAPNKQLKNVRQLLAGGAAMLVVGGAWPVMVWLTPAADRPWISGTADNSIWSLITGYNGLGRLAGQSGGPSSTGGLGGGGSVFGGSTGPLRLLNDALGGQVGWLLGFAVVSGIGLVVLTRLRRRDPATGWIIAVGGAALTTAVAFSFAGGIFHPYYVSLLAPFSAALVGAGVAQLLRHDSHARAIAPIAIAAGAITELVVMHTESALTWLEPVVVIVALAAGLLLASPMVGRRRLIALAAVLVTFSIAPAAWAVDTLGHATSSTFPAGGPADAISGGFGTGPQAGAFGGGRGRAGGFPGAGGPGAGGGPSGNAAPGSGRSGIASLFGTSGSSRGQTGGPGGFGGGTDTELSAAVRYAGLHGGGTVAVSSQSDADDEIIDYGADVAGIGGFSGNESQVTATWLAAEVRDGKLRWVLDDSSGDLNSGGRVGARDAMTWVSEACTRVSSVSGLYDCAGHADQILKAADASAK